MSLVSVKNLSKFYGAPALKDVSLNIERGEILGLVGASGSGKTTLGKILLDLVEPTSGAVFYDGVCFSSMKRAEKQKLRESIQMVFQDPYGSLNPQMTILEIVGEPLLIHRSMTSGERRVKVLELLSDVGLTEQILYCYPFELSGGQRQRVAIARALALNPEFIVFDEAVSALDASIQAQILNLLKNLQKKHGLTYLFISHDLSVVRYISTRVAVLHQGCLIEEAPTEELFGNPLHPYTHELIDAMRPAERVGTLPFLTPSLAPDEVDRDARCTFCSQCPQVKERCWSHKPELKEAVSGHRVACHAQN